MVTQTPLVAVNNGSGWRELHRHVMSCRRREETAAVLVVKADGLKKSKLPHLVNLFRETDSVTATRTRDGHRIVAVLDGKNLDGQGLERRLSHAAGRSLAFGWAWFPADGVTLRALLDRAATAIGDDALEPEATVAPLRRDGEPGGRPRTLSRVLVTGCAGFIGSHLSERLVDAGVEVLGVDCFTDYYARATKENNLERLRDEPRFAFRELDLSADDLSGLLEGVDTVVHLAAQPGVRLSFGRGFDTYVRHNVLASQRLLEEARCWPLASFVYASSSSVYGDAPSFPTDEEAPRQPVSPYGMTKVATEELAGVYHRSFGVPVTGLRYFTAYGPRQRPDMAFSRFLNQALSGEPISVLGDGRQVREFTYVDDVVQGTIAAAERGAAGGVYNVGGGTPVELRQALKLVEELVGRRLLLDHHPPQIGDARRTACDGSRAARELGFVPTTGLRHGVGEQLQWVLGRRRPLSATVPVKELRSA